MPNGPGPNRPHQFRCDEGGAHQVSNGGQNPHHSEPEFSQDKKYFKGNCYTCNQFGHTSKECPMLKNDNNQFPVKFCNFCKRYNHDEANCRTKVLADANLQEMANKSNITKFLNGNESA